MAAAQQQQERIDSKIPLTGGIPKDCSKLPGVIREGITALSKVTDRTHRQRLTQMLKSHDQLLYDYEWSQHEKGVTGYLPRGWFRELDVKSGTYFYFQRDENGVVVPYSPQWEWPV